MVGEGCIGIWTLVVAGTGEGECGLYGDGGRGLVSAGIAKALASSMDVVIK